MAEEVGEHHGDVKKRETDEQKAERILTEKLRRRRWTEADLGNRRKPAPPEGPDYITTATGNGADAGLDCGTTADGLSPRLAETPEAVEDLPPAGTLFLLPCAPWSRLEFIPATIPREGRDLL